MNDKNKKQSSNSIDLSKTPVSREAPGRILRVKQGYNPNSSSLGSIVFALPAVLLGATVGFGALSGIIMSAFLGDRKKSDDETPEKTERN
jgi:hypothetical protein